MISFYLGEQIELLIVMGVCIDFALTVYYLYMAPPPLLPSNAYLIYAI